MITIPNNDPDATLKFNDGIEDLEIKMWFNSINYERKESLFSYEASINNVIGELKLVDDYFVFFRHSGGSDWVLMPKKVGLYNLHEALVKQMKDVIAEVILLGAENEN